MQSWYLDVTLLAGYFGSERVYHHTAPISAIYGLAEGLRIVEEEGLEARAARHRAAARALVSGIAPLGFEPLVPEAIRLPMLTALRLPERVVARARPRSAGASSSATASRSAAGSASSPARSGASG